MCPRCGADLRLPEDLSKAHCLYCGAQIIIGGKGAGRRVECRACDGHGRIDICRACDGRGKCTWSTVSPGDRSNDILAVGFSSHCEDGKCSACRGTGRYMMAGCPGCKGTGKCPVCHGSGKCPVCRGAGIIPNPGGSEKCHLCDGAGLVDPEALDKHAVGRCPYCKRVWKEGESTCGHCGYVLNRCPSCGAVWIIGSLKCAKCGYEGR